MTDSRGWKTGTLVLWATVLGPLVAVGNFFLIQAYPQWAWFLVPAITTGCIVLPLLVAGWKRGFKPAPRYMNVWGAIYVLELCCVGGVISASTPTLLSNRYPNLYIAPLVLLVALHIIGRVVWKVGKQRHEHPPDAAD